MSRQCVMRALARGLLLAWPSLSVAAAEPNTQVPAGSHHYAATTVPDRIVASPAIDPSHGFAVAWRTDGSVQAPLLEIALAGDSPAIEGIRQVRAKTQELKTENGLFAVLEQRGLTREGAEPLERFARRLERADLGEAAALLLRYAAHRYGGVGDGEGLLADIDRCAASLRRA